jgi:colanic acid/amylovoran biosynthesis glycosyltransferase
MIAAPASDERAGTSVAYVIGTYPLLTTTFIDREVRLLRAWGAKVDIVSLRQPSSAPSPEQAVLAASTSYARPVSPLRLARRHGYFLARRPRAYVGTLAGLITSRGLSLRDRLRTAGHFGLGVSVAGQLREAGGCGRVHAHFIDRAATVAYVAAKLLAVPYSVTAHASDIYVSPVLLRTKVAGADFVATCTEYNQTHLIHAVPEAAGKITLAYHGLELEHYDPLTRRPTATPTLLAVGQLREKKGLTHLLTACRQLADRGLDFRCEIVGEGPQRADLERQVHDLGLGGIVLLHGALRHDSVIDAFRRAWLFVLPCVIGDDGDRDGIPNVILEAMAMGLPVVSTRCSGIPEVVGHTTTGLLVPPGDPAALADALQQVIDDPACASRMGAHGRAVVLGRFDAVGNVRTLRDQFAASGSLC